MTPIDPFRLFSCSPEIFFMVSSSYHTEAGTKKEKPALSKKEDVMNDLVPIVAILSVFGIPAAIIIVLYVLNHREKMGLIKSGFPSGVAYPGYPGRGSLLWGMIFTVVSAVSVILALIQNEYHCANLSAHTLALGVALLAYWKITAPHRQRDMEFYERRINQLK